jgi:hypothetical protein
MNHPASHLASHPALVSNPEWVDQLATISGLRDRDLLDVNARHSPSYGCALRLENRPFDALLGHARKTLSV